MLPFVWVMDVKLDSEFVPGIFFVSWNFLPIRFVHSSLCSIIDTIIGSFLYFYHNSILWVMMVALSTSHFVFVMVCRGVQVNNNMSAQVMRDVKGVYFGCAISIIQTKKIACGEENCSSNNPNEEDCSCEIDKHIDRKSQGYVKGWYDRLMAKKGRKNPWR